MTRSIRLGIIGIAMVLLSGCSAIQPFLGQQEATVNPMSGGATNQTLAGDQAGTMLTASAIPAIAQVATPTLTPTANITVAPTITPTPTPKVYRYVIQVGTPVQTVNFLYPELGCNWMGVGGQVFGLDGTPKEKVIVKITGSLGGANLMLLGMTGINTQLGPGGYEIKLADKPIESTEMLMIQLFDLAGNPISELTPFSTTGADLGCERNFILINYNETLAGMDNKLRLPLIYRKLEAVTPAP